MAKLQDAQAPYLTLAEQAAAPATPPAGAQGLFIDGADGQLKRINASGTVTVIEGGGGGGGSAGRVLLAETTLTSDTATLGFTSSDIPSSGYRHLEILIVARSAKAASAYDPLFLTVNGDGTTGNYTSQTVRGLGTGVAALNSLANNIGYVAAASAAAGAPGFVRITFMEYLDTAWHKLIEAISYGPGIRTSQGTTWASTAAITAISLTPSGGNFVAGSKALLYGLT